MDQSVPRPTYAIEFLPAAARRLRKLPNDIQRRLDHAILKLRDVPKPSGVKKLRSQGDRYRIRVGDYRIIYQIYNNKLIVLIVDVDHRKDIYRE
ncbi:MAG TPA: type II toxin-antitoxin system RelE/ParE family toxin [Pirellulales bacterium]|jgi:mRNA interferase RelE/StbE